jgi:hypothetical protein
MQPHAVGGPPVVDNIELRCRARNVHEAEQFFGRRWPLLARESGGWAPLVQPNGM